ncbi:hypothetical protein AB0I72_11430 [Nocardiopsis sp. NPDC049922]|uniref:hypothetical protein n=1 Tax=Nocardiopsis sp. NPDC049922 TaxID=3155157 RepID=UPI0033C93E96
MSFPGGVEWSRNPDINAGLNAARDRMMRYGMDLPYAEIAPDVEMAVELLYSAVGENSPDSSDPSGRSIELLVEIVAVSGSVRYYHNEGTLKHDEIISFTNEYINFINSWKDRPPR